MQKKLSDADRSRRCIEYAVHSREVRAALDAFADKLAKCDDVLRVELRLIEEFLR